MIKAHPSLFLLAFAVAGIVLGDRLPVSPVLGLALAAVSAGGAVLAFFKNRPSMAALLAGSALGLVTLVNFGLQLRGIGPNHLAALLKEPTLCQVCGRVSDWPALKPGRTEIEIAIDSLSPADQAGATFREVDGSLLLKVSDTTTALQRGDRVCFRARVYPVKRGEGETAGYGRYLNLRGIYAQAFLPTVLNIQVDRRPAVGLWPIVDRVRSAVCASLERNLSPTASALARGFLIGETRDIPADVYSLFRDTGTLHVLAVSGANVALVLLFFLWALRPFWFGPRARTLILLGIIVLFSGVSYGDPSVVRAAIMAALVLGARLLGRVYDLNNIIAATALVILLVRPTELYDVGFQLSFATAWGLIFIVPRLGEAFGRLRERRWYRWVLMPVLVSIVAQIVSAPLILYYFERLPLISPAANLVVVPLVSIGVVGAMILLVADLVWPMLGLMLGGLVDLWLRGLLRTLKFFGGDTVPVVQSSFLSHFEGGATIVILAYLLLVLGTWAIGRKWARRTLVIVGALLLNSLLLYGLFGPGLRTGSEAWVKRVPGGLAILVTDPDRARAELVVTGLTRTPGYSSGDVIGGVVRGYGVKHLARLIVLGGDYDALGDLLRLAREYEVDSLLVSNRFESSISDLLIRGDSGMFQGAVVYLSGRAVEANSPGLYVSDDRVTLRTRAARVDIVDRLADYPGLSPDPTFANTLVIGGRWQPEAAEWISLHRGGYDRIVCSDFEQAESVTWPDAELEPDALPPDFLIDLAGGREIRLSLGR